MSASLDIVIDLVLPSGDSVVQANVPTSHTAAHIIAEMVEAFSLPLRNESKRVDYELFWEQQGKVLSAEQTLAEAGVQSGHRLHLRAPIELPKPVGNLATSVRDDEKTIPVTIEFRVDNYAHEPAQETLVYDDTVRAVIDQLVKRLDLPRTLYDRPAIYKLSSKALKAELQHGLTLRQQHVPKHDSLWMAAERPAG